MLNLKVGLQTQERVCKKQVKVRKNVMGESGPIGSKPKSKRDFINSKRILTK